MLRRFRWLINRLYSGEWAAVGWLRETVFTILLAFTVGMTTVTFVFATLALGEFVLWLWKRHCH